MKTAAEVHHFWFKAHGPDDWFAGKPAFDALIEAEFAETHKAIARGEGWTWRTDATGRLAEIIVLDQFSRQLYRGRPEAFAQDPMALALSQELVVQGLDTGLSEDETMFAYLPYMHSESLVVHDEAMRLFTALGNDKTLDFERQAPRLHRPLRPFPQAQRRALTAIDARGTGVSCQNRRPGVLKLSAVPQKIKGPAVAEPLRFASRESPGMPGGAV